MEWFLFFNVKCTREDLILNGNAIVWVHIFYAKRPEKTILDMHTATQKYHAHGFMILSWFLTLNEPCQWIC